MPKEFAKDTRVQICKQKSALFWIIFDKMPHYLRIIRPKGRYDPWERTYHSLTACFTAKWSFASTRFWSLCGGEAHKIVCGGRSAECSKYVCSSRSSSRGSDIGHPMSRRERGSSSSSVEHAGVAASGAPGSHAASPRATPPTPVSSSATSFGDHSHPSGASTSSPPIAPSQTTNSRQPVPSTGDNTLKDSQPPKYGAYT